MGIETCKLRGTTDEINISGWKGMNIYIAGCNNSPDYFLSIFDGVVRKKEKGKSGLID